MNKNISLAIVGVLLCAIGAIFFTTLRSANDEPQGELIPPVALSDNETDSQGESSRNGLPLIAEETSPQAPPATPPQAVAPQTTPQVTQPKVTPPKVTTPPATQTTPQTTTPQTAQTKPAQPAEKTPPSLKPIEPQTTATTSKPAVTPPTAKGTYTLSKIGLHFRGNDIYLRIEADAGFKTKVFALSGPDRLVVDLVGKWNAVTAPHIPSNQLVTKARVGQQPNATRLVLDLSRATKYTIHKVSDTVVEITMQ